MCFDGAWNVWSHDTDRERHIIIFTQVTEDVVEHIVWEKVHDQEVARQEALRARFGTGSDL